VALAPGPPRRRRPLCRRPFERGEGKCCWAFSLKSGRASSSVGYVLGYPTYVRACYVRTLADAGRRVRRQGYQYQHRHRYVHSY
jgi:hypothetical protein